MSEHSILATEYLRTVREHLEEIPNAVNRARLLHEEITAIGDVIKELSALRRTAVTEARTETSTQAIADALGISRARVYKLLEDAG